MNRTDPTGEFGLAGAAYGAVAGAIGGYVSSGSSFRERAIGVITGALVGAAVGVIAPESSSFAASAAVGAVASVLGQVAGSVATAAVDKGLTKVRLSDVKVSVVTTAAGALGSGIGAAIGRGLAASTTTGIVGRTLEEAGGPATIGVITGTSVESAIGGATEKYVPPILDSMKQSFRKIPDKPQKVGN